MMSLRFSISLLTLTMSLASVSAQTLTPAYQPQYQVTPSLGGSYVQQAPLNTSGYIPNQYYNLNSQQQQGIPTPRQSLNLPEGYIDPNKAQQSQAATQTSNSPTTNTTVDLTGQRIEGVAKVIDGKTLLINQNLFVLNGADAPSVDQTCTNPQGMTWECGRRAKNRLEQLVDGHHVVCVGTSPARGGTAAKCKVGTTDLGKTMVRDGLAVAPKAVVTDYVVEEAEAKAEQIGVWSGTFKAPWDYRSGD